jgi:hypothetical protein
MGWRTGQKSLFLPVAGEFSLLTLPFIERTNRPFEVQELDLSGFPTYRPLGCWKCPRFVPRLQNR